MRDGRFGAARFRNAAGLVVMGSMLAVVASGTWLAPSDPTIGDAQRMMYIHVPIAWIGLLAFLLMAGAGALFLLRRDLRWDHWAHAAAELGWLSCGLTLVTGSLWARAAWGTWWTWDPRLTATFVLWLIYSGCLAIRGGLIADAPRRARLAAVLACIGALDIPLVIMATRWFRGIHPVAPQIDPAMRSVLLLNAACLGAAFMVALHRRQLHWRRREAAPAPQPGIVDTATDAGDVPLRQAA